MNAYPVSKPQRRERFAAVMAGLRDYSAEELDVELLDLFTTHKALSQKTDNRADAFLNYLRKQAKLLRIQEPPGT